MVRVSGRIPQIIFVTEGLLPRALRVFAGTAVRSVQSEDEAMNPVNTGSPLVFATRFSRKLTNTLTYRGYHYIYRFIFIPPRWLLPTENRAGMLSGTQIYEPHKWTPQVAKKVVRGMLQKGWKGWPCLKILVASRARLALETLVRDVTGETDALFALSLGRQATVSKLTVQVMRPSGDILGYMKIPLTHTAIARVRNEARLLERLSSFPIIRGHIPRLLYAGTLNNTYILFQSAVPGERGPLVFGGAHSRFLQALRNVHSKEVPRQTVVETVGAKWEKAVRHLGTAWAELGQEVLRSATSDLPGKALTCGVMHGDFTPWNTRVQQEELFLFDWESGCWEAPVLWDMFHFQVQTSFFFGTAKELCACKRDASERISFMLFSLSSVSQFLEERNYDAIGYYKKFLIAALHRKPEGVETPASAA